MRGYFAVGVEGISKEQNVGNLVRSAHSFGASFFFAIAPCVDIQNMKVSDTADSFQHLPYYQYDTLQDFELPKECQLVGVELTQDAINLPSFRHPMRAAYILGPEMGSLSSQTLEMCDHVIKIPTKFCVNVGVAGALVMYDRILCHGGLDGRYADRPVMPGGPYIQSTQECLSDMQGNTSSKKVEEDICKTMRRKIRKKKQT